MNQYGISLRPRRYQPHTWYEERRAAIQKLRESSGSQANHRARRVAKADPPVLTKAERRERNRAKALRRKRREASR